MIVKTLVMDSTKEDYGVYVCPPRLYQRMSRFRCILNWFVSGCDASLPGAEFARLQSDLVTRKIPICSVTGVHAKQSLRRLRLGEFSDAVPGIIARLTRAPRLRLDGMQMEQVRQIFRAIEQSIYVKGRVHMPSYAP